MITNNAKTDLYNVLKQQQATSDKQSNTLPKPFFNGEHAINFSTDIKTYLGATNDITINEIAVYKDMKVVSAHTTQQTGVIAIFDLENQLIDVFDKIDDPTNPNTKIDLLMIKTLRIDGDGIIYGLMSQGLKKYTFFRLSDLLSQVGILQKQDIDLFYSGYVDLTTETPKDPTKPTENIMGSVKFGDGTIYEIEKSFNEENTYIILGYGVDKKIYIIKLQVPLGAITQQQVDWVLNEPINKLNGTSSDTTFDSLSNIGVSTGNKSIGTDKSIIGSILLASSDTTTITALKHYGEDYINEDVIGQNKKYGSQIHPTDIAMDFSSQLVKTKQHLDTINAQNIKVHIEVDLNSFVSGTKNQIINFDDINDPNKNWHISKSIFDNQDLKFEFKYHNDDFELVIKSGTSTIQTINTNLIDRRDFGGRLSRTGWTYDIRPHIKIRIEYDINESHIAEAATQFISIELDGTNVTYTTKVIENDIYAGGQPIFVNLTKAYIPLLDKGSGQYNIYEFDLEQIPAPSDEYRVYIPSDYVAGGAPYVVQIEDKKRMISATQNGAIYTGFTSNIDQTAPFGLYHVQPNDLIVIKYQSIYARPKKVLLESSTSASHKVILASVDNNDELNYINKSIVGVGSDTNKNRMFGFTLYKNNPSSIDSNAIAEQVENSALVQERVVAARQNDILYIFAYDRNYTKEVKWLSIYPESYKPYTYNEYNDINNEFVLERINGADKTGTNINLSKFDNEFQNVSSSSNTIIASSEAKTTDFNFVGDILVSTFGHTNKKIFENSINNFAKTRQEARQINFTVNSKVIDKSSGVDIERIEASNTVGDIFHMQNVKAPNQLTLKFKIYYEDNTSEIKDITNNLTILKNNDNEDVLRLNIDLDGLTKQIEKLELLNQKDELIGQKIGICSGENLNIQWDIRISNTNNATTTKKGGA